MSVLSKNLRAAGKRPLEAQKSTGAEQIVATRHERLPHAREAAGPIIRRAIDGLLPDLYLKFGLPIQHGRFRAATDDWACRFTGMRKALVAG